MAVSRSKLIIGPQEGPQTKFLTCQADICIYGGAAGGGKSFGLLLEPIRHLNNPHFSATFFRRTNPMIRAEGGLWDTSTKIYPLAGARPVETNLYWKFPKGYMSKVSFKNLEHDKSVLNYQGSQMPFVGFDELTQFTRKQFFYVVSRLRSDSGVPGYLRATCNPDPKSWVKKFIQWWLDEKTGLPIPERDGVLRYFIRVKNKIVWASTIAELKEKYNPQYDPMSVTFIKSTVYDNKILLKNDPSYLAKLHSLDPVTRAQLLGGNWNIVEKAGTLFKRHFFEVVDALPSKAEIIETVRAWDRAATKVNDDDDNEKTSGDPDWTVGAKLSLTYDGRIFISDIRRERDTPFNIDRLILNTARQDGVETKIKLFQDPGSAGVYEINALTTKLGGFNFEVEKVIKDKITNAKPLSSQSEAGNVKILRAEWNDDFYDEFENFPDGAHDDIVDACSSAYNELTLNNVGAFPEEIEENIQDNNPLLDGNISW